MTSVKIFLTMIADCMTPMETHYVIPTPWFYHLRAALRGVVNIWIISFPVTEPIVEVWVSQCPLPCLKVIIKPYPCVSSCALRHTHQLDVFIFIGYGGKVIEVLSAITLSASPGLEVAYIVVLFDVWRHSGQPWWRKDCSCIYTHNTQSPYTKFKQCNGSGICMQWSCNSFRWCWIGLNNAVLFYRIHQL